MLKASFKNQNLHILTGYLNVKELLFQFHFYTGKLIK